MAVLSKMIYKFSAISVNVLMEFIIGVDKVLLAFLQV